MDKNFKNVVFRFYLQYYTLVYEKKYAKLLKFTDISNNVNFDNHLENNIDFYDLFVLIFFLTVRSTTKIFFDSFYTES